MISIRKITQEDKQQVLEMMRVFYDSPAVFYTAPTQILEKDIDDCISELPFIEGFVFEDSQALAGYAMIAPSYTTEYGGLCIWFEDIYIKPEYRRIGLATMLFDFVEKCYPTAVRFKLEVEQENEGAIATYKRNGYSISPYFEMTKER